MFKKLKALMLVVLLGIFITACSKSPEVHLTAIVESVSEASMTVTAEDNASFDKAMVQVGDKTEIVDTNGKTMGLKDIAPGTIVNITYNGEVRESYPVQLSADKIVVNLDESAINMNLGQYKKLTPQEAKEQLDDDSGIIILDVRTDEEHAEERIDKSVLLPDYEVKDRAAEVLPNKDAKIFVYCRSGRRSEAAARALLEMGYKNVYDIGGIIDWPFGTVKG